MICYLYPASEAGRTPKHLEGARDLCARPADDGGLIYGIGPSYLCGGDISSAIQLSDCKMWVNGAIDSYHLFRVLRGQPTLGIEDTKGRVWQLPVMIGPGGRRMFQARYGAGWKPIFTKEQSTLVEMAEAAPQLLRSLEVGDPDALGPACEIASECLCYTHHLTKEIIQNLDILDDTLIVSALTALCCYEAGVENAQAQ